LTRHLFLPVIPHYNIQSTHQEPSGAALVGNSPVARLLAPGLEPVWTAELLRKADALTSTTLLPPSMAPPLALAWGLALETMATTVLARKVLRWTSSLVSVDRAPPVALATPVLVVAERITAVFERKVQFTNWAERVPCRVRHIARATLVDQAADEGTATNTTSLMAFSPREGQVSDVYLREHGVVGRVPDLRYKGRCSLLPVGMPLHS
jgi:hypothetical protein